MMLELYYQNVRGLNGKFNHLLPLISLLCYDIICFTETWLREDFNSSLIFPPNQYQVYRKDRNLHSSDKSTGGGVLIALKNNLKADRLYGFEHPNLEMVWIRVNLIIPVYLCNIYFPNRSMAENYHTFLKVLQDNIASIESSVKDYHVIICGDFNLSTIEWENHSNGTLFPINYLNNDLHGINAEIVHSMNCFELNQFNYISNTNNRILDLILSDLSPHNIRCTEPVTILCPFIDNHHPPVQVSINVKHQNHLVPVETARYNFPKTDYWRLNRLLSDVQWQSELVGTVDDMVGRFYDIVTSIIDEIVPVKRRRESKYPVWFSTALIFALQKKNRLHREWKRTGNRTVYNEFSDLRNKVKNMVYTCFRRFVGVVEDNMFVHMREFWRFTKSLRKTNTYPASMVYGTNFGTFRTDSSEGIANLFAFFFDSVYCSDDADAIELPSRSNTSFSKMSVTPDQVKAVLKQLNTDKGAGDDGISNHFYKNTAANIALPLSIIFNASLANGVFPDKFKDTIIHPIFKKGDQGNVENYRPIAILNAISKIFEKLVHEAVLFHVLPYLNESQHGFLPRKSTVTNLVEYVSFLAQKLDRKAQIDAIYLDFSKAFDKISHRLLLAKLSCFGFTGAMLSWFKSYISDRHLTVVFNGSRSQSFTPTSGVAQGSILGPLLFVLYIDDMNDICDSFKLFYADDCKLIKEINSTEDSASLQQDLSAVESWCNSNKLPLNNSKCTSLSFTNKTVNAIQTTYVLNGSPISSSSSTKDLGVYVDKQLRFSENIENMVNKAYRSLGFVIRMGRHFVTLDAIMHLYVTLVRPHLDYASVVWSPHYSIHENAVERVQRRFTRFVFRKFRMPYCDYNDRLKRLKLLSLRKRRMMTDQMFLFNLVNGNIALKSSVINVCYRTDRSTRNRQLFVENTWRINAAFASPIPRILRNYNRHFHSLDIFSLSKSCYKDELYELLCTMPD